MFRHFKLLDKLVGCSPSFRVMPCLMHCTRGKSEIAKYAGCNDIIALKHIRVVYAASLQIISDFLKKLWAVFLALNGSKHQSRSYLHVCVRFVVETVFSNLKLMETPPFERHTA